MTGKLTVSVKLNPFPFAALAVAYQTGKAEVVFEDDVTGPVLDLEGTKTTLLQDIVHALARAGDLFDDKAKTEGCFALAETIPRVTAVPEIIVALDSLDDHLAYRTFAVGHGITTADWMLWGAIKGSGRVIGILKNGTHAHLLRYFNYLETLLPAQTAQTTLTEAKAHKARSNKTAAGFALGLQNAKEGEVVTRFPPEPSGYLHIGHAKAAMLNQYFAKMYKGKLIVRFDDTNPSKERTEFEETILEDLRLIGIEGDKITHTSDYFDTLHELAVKLIKEGKAYADDTEQPQMRAERMEGIASKHRDDHVEQNLARFAEMAKGTEEGCRWCIRAKMSVDNPNKAMRDPVIYRCNLLPHHRTGDKWKVYPTYDFACPAVDSLEGVTHALRTNEYRDRNPQYQWMIDNLGLRQVHIWDFSRLSFIYTLLSKRKLHWFVDHSLVRGWDDPRFPTVRGIRRRGLTVEALQQYMLSQGPSSSIVSLEWDSIWALNKKVIDPIAPRFWAILSAKQVPVTIVGGPQTLEVKTLPKHKKNPDVGEKQTVYTSNILVEQEDALSFEDQEEITLMDWGNAIVRSWTADSSGSITAVTMELHLEGDFRKTKKKITWLARPTAEHPLVPITLLDYDYLITKKKLEEDDKLDDFVTPVTEFREDAVADANVKEVKKGDIIQFERKGYFICDGSTGSGDSWRMEFIRIPDGKAASLASKANVTPAEPAAKPNVPSRVEILNDIPVDTKMYRVQKVYGDDFLPEVETKMYKMPNIHTSD